MPLTKIPSTMLEDVDISLDPTPVLGGDLDGDGNTITNVPGAINAQTGTTYTLTATDANKIVTCNNASGITLTLPEDATENLDVGFMCTVIQLGTGQVTVTVENADALYSKNVETKTTTIYSAFVVIKLAAGVWFVTGDMTV